MDLSKLRTGEMVAAIGGLVLLLALFAFDWYEIPASAAWSSSSASRRRGHGHQGLGRSGLLRRRSPETS